MAARYSVLLCVCAVLAAHASVSAQAADIAVADDNKRFSFPIPESAFATPDVSLAIELDGYDVTNFARIDGSDLVVDLDTPLAAGEHAVALYAFAADDSADVLFEETLEVVAVASSELTYNTVFESNYRAGENPASDFDGIDSVASSGSLALAASRSTGARASGIGLETIYDGAAGGQPGGADWLLPYYELYTGYAGDRNSAWLVAGNIALSQDDLLFSTFQRRGLALETSLSEGRVEIKAFSVNAAPQNDFGGGYLLPSDSDEQSSGVAGSLRIVDKRLQLGGGFIDGKSTFGGAGYNFAYDPTVYGGDSWNVSADSRWLEDSVWIRLERAASDFDFDGIGIGLPASSGEASQAMLQVSSNGALGSGPFQFWSAVMQHRKVSRDFYTLGNLSMPGNIEATSGWFQGGFASTVIDVEVAMEKTNPDEDPLYASQKLARSGVNVAWSPATLDAERTLWKWLGAPSVSAWRFRASSTQPDSDTLLAGFDVDNRTDDTGISVAFARDALSWTVEYGVVDYDDRSSPVIQGSFILYEPYSDSRNRHLAITAAWLVSERASLEAFLQMNTLEETDFGDEYRSTGFGVSGNLVLLPDKVSLSASLSRGKDRNVFGDAQFLPEQFESDYAGLQLNWQVAPTRGARPAISLFLKGHYASDENIGLAIQRDQWAIYIGGSLHWAENTQ